MNLLILSLRDIDNTAELSSSYNNFVYDICRFINRQMSIYYNAFILTIK